MYFIDKQLMLYIALNHPENIMTIFQTFDTNSCKRERHEILKYLIDNGVDMDVIYPCYIYWHPESVDDLPYASAYSVSVNGKILQKIGCIVYPDDLMETCNYINKRIKFVSEPMKKIIDVQLNKRFKWINCDSIEAVHIRRRVDKIIKKLYS